MTWGLVADPAQMRQQVEGLTGAVPASSRKLILAQIDNVATTSSSSLGIGLVLTLALALWSASGGVGNLMTAINLAYDEEDNRGFIKKKLLALGLTLAAIVFMLLALGLVAVVPAIFSAIGIPTAWLVIFQVLRWVLVVVLVGAALAVLYRVAPDRDAPQMRWVSIGAIVATVLWLVASFGFSLYVSNFGSYDKTYGTLAAVVVLLMWLWITSYAVLLGAEINAESEQQTAKDTTTGPAKPLGQRNAVKADSLPPPE
jgi:membrane protein